MSLVIEAEVLILVNPDRWDRPKFGDIAKRRDGGEGERLRKNEVPSMAHLPVVNYESAATSEPNGRLHSPVGDARKRPGNFFNWCQAPLPMLDYLCLSIFAAVARLTGRPHRLWAIGMPETQRGTRGTCQRGIRPAPANALTDRRIW